MVEIKEIKSIELAQFTLMSSSIHAIIAFIGAIVMLIAFGIMAALIPQFKGISAFLFWMGVSLLIIYPISTFFINIAVSFFGVLLYNNLVSRLGGIKLGMELSEVKEVPIISFSLILAIIEAIWAFIIGLFLAALFTPFTAFLSGSIPTVSQAIANVTNMTGTTIPTGALVGAMGAFGAFLLIIGLPISVLIIGFIGNALAAIFYNYIATSVVKIRLEFATISGTLQELKTIPVVPLALASGVVAAVFGLIMGIFSLISFSALGNPAYGLYMLIYNIIRYFLQTFIIAALIAIFYNYLAPRIGGIKLNLE